MQEKNNDSNQIPVMKHVGLYRDGFHYIHHRKYSNGFKALTCANSRKGCKATAKIPPDGDLEQIILLKGHNHPPDMNLERKHNFLQELRKVVSATLHTVPLRSIYESVLELHQEVTDVSFKTIESSMRRWRKVNL